MIMLHNGPAGMARSTTCSRRINSLTVIVVGGVLIALISATTPVHGFIAAPTSIPAVAPRSPTGYHRFAPTPDLASNGVSPAGISSSLLHMDTRQQEGAKCRRRTVLSVVSRQALSETEVRDITVVTTIRFRICCLHM